MIKYIFILILSQLFILGCQSAGVVIESTPLSMPETRKVISQVLVEVREVSPTGREISSHYYDDNGKFLNKPESAKIRYYSYVRIDGTRRPYDVVVEVIIEKKYEGEFEAYGADDTKSATLAEKIREELYQGRNKRNVVDDFKPF